MAATGSLMAGALLTGAPAGQPPATPLAAESPRPLADSFSALFSPSVARPALQAEPARFERTSVSERASRSSAVREVIGSEPVVPVPADAPVVAAPGPAKVASVADHGDVLAFVGVTPAASTEETTVQAAGTSERTGQTASRSGDRGSGAATAPEPAPAPPVSSGSGAAETAIGWAMNHLGLPYGVGATGPGSYDCSGFTQAAYGAAGVYLPQGSGSQYAATRRVPLSEIRRGDLLFYSGSSGIYHVAIYLGGGQVVHALRDWSGAFSGSKVTGMHYSPGLMGAGRP